jgi:cytochrome P450
MIRSAVEELLRYESPVQFTARVLKEDIEVCGQQIRKGWTVLCMLGAANRDPKQFKDPNQLDLKRLNNQHLAFSAGLHFCIGAQLARLEGQIAILNLVQRFPEDEAHWPATGVGLLHSDSGASFKSLPVIALLHPKVGTPDLVLRPLQVHGA